MLDQPLGFFDHHLGHRNVTCGRFVKGGADNFTFHRSLHIGHLFRPLVDQQNDQVTFRVIVRLNARRNVLQYHGLTGPRRGHDQRPLSLPDGRYEVDYTGGFVLDGRIFDFHLQPFVRVKRRQVVEGNLVLGLFRILEVDLRDRGQRKVPLVFLWCLDEPLDRIPGPQREFADHFGRDIDVVGARQVVCLG